MRHVIKPVKPDASSFYRALYGAMKGNPGALNQFIQCISTDDDVALPTESAFVKIVREAASVALSANQVDKLASENNASLPAWVKKKKKSDTTVAHVKQMMKKRTTMASVFDIDAVQSLINACFPGKKLVVMDATQAVPNARIAQNLHQTFVLIRDKDGNYSYVVAKSSVTSGNDFKSDPKIEIQLPEWKLPNRFSFQSFIDNNFKYTGASKSSLFPSQRFVKDFIRPDNPYRGLLLYHGLGAGKCHARDTPILMHDGSIKMVQDVAIGDMIMGDDSTPRTVVSLARGTDHMYDVIQTGGDTYRVNNSHILCLMHPHRGICEIECGEFVTMSTHQKSILKGYAAVIDFPPAETPCDPYMLGFWLADAGPSNMLGYTKLPSAMRHLKRGLVGSNTAALRGLVEADAKHVPNTYVRNTIHVRQRVLAGLMDADGCKSCLGLFVMVKAFDLAQDIIALARSVGLFAKSYRQPRRRLWLVRLYGINVSTIACKFLKTAAQQIIPQPSRAIHVVYGGFDQYYGFAVDGNHRYVLGDYTVTHNSCAAIVASENLIGTMRVDVLLPASLQTNFLDEIKRQCGNVFFSSNKHWRFLSLERLQNQVSAKKKSDVLKYASDVTMVDVDVIRKNKGVWIADADVAGSSPNFDSLSDPQKAAINMQLNSWIKNKYNFINYNGLSSAKVKSMVAASQNPFSNKVVIIDEVHNFISRALGGETKTGMPLYKLLLHAKNCKLILLSGTPLINHPYELSYIVNLVKGVQEVHELKFRSKDALDKAEKRLAAHEYVDHSELNIADLKATIQLCPEGFKFSNKPAFMVAKDPANKPADEVMASICKELGCKYDAKKDKKEYLVMPENKDKFISTFVDESSGKVKNEFQMARRIMGSISHYATVGSDFPTQKPTTFVNVPMSDYQFGVYEQVRLDEIRKESRMARAARDGGVFADMPSTYRAYSRMVCNFVFPEGINRPYKAFKKSTEFIEDNDDPTYERAVKALETAHEVHLRGESLAKLSPKTSAMLEKIKGKCLIYSEYLVAEGLGHVAMALRANGWTEMRLKKTAGNWQLDMPAKDLKTPKKFFRFSTAKEEVEIMKALYNNDLNRVPASILKALGGTTNLRGEMLQAILISKSGAEGISLKHVRQVHILEPYWHEVRINQIIGRAVRAHSHADLPLNERNVDVFRYMCTFTKEMIKNSVTLRTKDKSKPTDKHVYDVAAKKDNIIQSVQRVMMAAAVDCKIHKHRHPDVECMAFPDTDELAYNWDIDKDDIIIAKKKKTVQEKRFRNCAINGIHYAYDGATNTLYDLEAYQSGQLVRLRGIVKDATNNWRVTE